MNDQKEKKKPEAVIRAEQLSDDGKLDEALTLLIDYEQKEGLTRHDKASCHLLQCQILLWQGKYKELYNHAKQTYKESEGLENNFLKIDSLLLMVRASLLRHDKLDEAFELFKQGEELLKTLPQEVPTDYKQREALIAFVKGLFYERKNDVDRALEHYEHSLALREELGIKHEIAESLGQMVWVLCIYKGELDRAFNCAKRGLNFAKRSTKKFYIAHSLKFLAVIYGYQGELDRSIRFHEQSIEVFRELNNKTLMASLLNNVGDSYRMKGELDRALECLEQSLALHQELGNLGPEVNCYDFLIQVLIDKGDLERAQQYLHDMEQLSSQSKNKQINKDYLFDKALLLKTSLRARNRAKAEEIFNYLLEDKDLRIEFTIGALINLCELLLTELRMTNDVEVLDEINPLIARLLDIAEKLNSYWILCETLLIQAKLSLLTFDIKKAQRFLTQAQQIAERFGLNQLATKIVSENDDLFKKLDLWEKLKESGAPMSDRMELARLDEKIVRMIQKHHVLPVQVSEEKIAVSIEKKICLVCRGEVLRFTYICECGAIYCENCARALTNLENVCWACDVPIDYSKPVKKFKEEERVEIGKKSKKK